MNQSLHSELALSKEQLYDLFQQILGVKKFEHQLLFNALQVRKTFSCFDVYKKSDIQSSIDLANLDYIIDEFLLLDVIINVFRFSNLAAGFIG